MLSNLNAAVQTSEAYNEAQSINAVRPLPTGDGMALLFFNDVLAPARCAIQVTREMRSGPQDDRLPLRMGIHSGLVLDQFDISGRGNVVGEGINTAQRVMDFGDSGHILVSAQNAHWLMQFDDWQPLLYSLGPGTAKHGQTIELFSLWSKECGNESLPSSLTPKEPSIGSAAPQRTSTQLKIAILHKPNLQPDERVQRMLHDLLSTDGYEVFIDNQLRINRDWATAIEEPIRRADAVISIVSSKAMQSEMLEFEIETAIDQHARTGKPILLPVYIGTEEIEESPTSALLKPLNRFTWHGPDNDQKLISELISAIHEPVRPQPQEVQLEPVGGAVPPDSSFYVERSSDREFRQALLRQESILLIKGARQMGKTSMQAQGVKLAREQGWRCGISDFQKFNTHQMSSDEVFYKLLAATLARQLKFKYDFESEWDPIFGCNLNMENFLRELIDHSPEPMIWFMDEADKLFGASFASDFFGLIRSWHNSRSTEPGGPWDKLTVVIAYATEAHLFIQDLNQSPFNVGRRLEMEDFNIRQIADLNDRYGGPLQTEREIERLHALIGGQPFLIRRALDILATGKFELASMEEHADRDDGPFGDHLKRILVSVLRIPNIIEYVRGLLAGHPTGNSDAFYRLLAAGIINQGDRGNVRFRCRLYESYLKHHLG